MEGAAGDPERDSMKDLCTQFEEPGRNHNMPKYSDSQPSLPAHESLPEAVETDMSRLAPRQPDKQLHKKANLPSHHDSPFQISLDYFETQP